MSYFFITAKQIIQEQYVQLVHDWEIVDNIEEILMSVLDEQRKVYLFFFLTKAGSREVLDIKQISCDI